MKILVTSAFIPGEFAKRKRLLMQLRDAGHELTVAGHEPAGKDVCDELGIEFALVPLADGKVRPFADLRMLRSYRRLMRRERFDAVLSYTAKPNIYASIAAHSAKVPGIYPTVNGLGYAFLDRSGLKYRALRFAMCRLYRIAFSHATKVLFQNPDDMEEMVRRKLVARDKCVVISGSGIDLEEFPFVEPQVDGVFLFAARLLLSKGIRTYASAARIVKRSHPEVRFLVAGAKSPNPDGLKDEDLAQYVGYGTLEYLGEVDDMPAALADCSVLVLPTSYREGIPHVLLEAMSTGRAIVTTNMPGCRETINGENGFLVQPEDEGALAEKMLWMIDHPEETREMGRKGRAYAEERFDVEKVNASIMKAMGL